VARALWLADELRSWDLDVVEVDGWRTRGADNLDPRVVVCHHTAGPPGEIPSLSTLIAGRGGEHPVPGPLSNLGLGRSGRVYVVASGTSNNAGNGAWLGITGNRHTLGIEAENNGVGEPWPAVQLDAYRRVVAALCSGAGITPAFVCGHKEWAPGRKIDPAGVDMHQFRAAVTQLLTPTTPEVDDMTPEQAGQLAQVVEDVRNIRAALRKISPQIDGIARTTGDFAQDLEAALATVGAHVDADTIREALDGMMLKAP
jgi:hypothetical protein